MRIVGSHDCFYIDPLTGYIHVKAYLKSSACSANSYTFYVIAEDLSRPPRQSNQAQVTMEIRRYSNIIPTGYPNNVTIGKQCLFMFISVGNVLNMLFFKFAIFLNFSFY